MKRYRMQWAVAVIVIFLLIAVVFWPPLSSLVSVRAVQGQRFYSPLVSSEERWFAGYSIFILRPPIFRISGDESIVWRSCKSLHKGIAGIFNNFPEFNEVARSSFEVIAESNAYGYSAYIKSGTILIYLSMYEDKSGDLPDMEEREICAQ